MKLHHLQRRDCKPETKKNPVIKLELLEVVPWTSGDPKGASGKDHLLPNLCAWVLLPFPQTLPLNARLTSPCSSVPQPMFTVSLRGELLARGYSPPPQEAYIHPSESYPTKGFLSAFLSTMAWLFSLDTAILKFEVCYLWPPS